MSYILAQLKEASNLLQKKDFKKAENIYKNLLYIIPGLPDAYYGLYKLNFLQSNKIYEEYFEKALFNLSLTAGYKKKMKKFSTNGITNIKAL